MTMLSTVPWRTLLIRIFVQFIPCGNQMNEGIHSLSQLKYESILTTRPVLQ